MIDFIINKMTEHKKVNGKRPDIFEVTYENGVKILNEFISTSNNSKAVKNLKLLLKNNNRKEITKEINGTRIYDVKLTVI